ncbi:MAG: dTDP-glucose 4,6-dehydratase [Deltaproteobacteria bacterium]|jgi:dTDP-glucose 4,6-dehydratase|nr:dTDP-glucose 4,6-dehydratase [Deltaproteobacteria bacterium]
MTILVTGGLGFIGTNFILGHLASGGDGVVDLDLATYAGNPANLSHLPDGEHLLVRGDVCDRALADRLLAEHRPRAVVHLAAESHVDRSISGPAAFVQTNIVGTFTLLEAAKAHWESLDGVGRDAFRFLYVSTDEVYGSLGPDDPPFTERSPCAPNSPYSASKAAGDHLARSYFKTYGFPAMTTHCSNNYGPYQFPEKLIPLMIINAIAEKPLPVYGDGRQVRDWIHVEDHARALSLVLERGAPGETYNVGGRSERANMEVLEGICTVLDETAPRAGGLRHIDLAVHVADRPGHDRRYAVDSTKIEEELGFYPSYSFPDGLEAAVCWYRTNSRWVESVTSGEYRDWLKRHYGMGG